MATKTTLKNLKGSTEMYDAGQTDALASEVSKHYEATIAFDATTSDLEAIAAAVGENTPMIGNTAVVKKAITDATEDIPYTYTAYVYNGTQWVAMDGNYSADNVIFDDNMLITYDWGKYTINKNGYGSSISVPAKGLSVKQLFNQVLVDVKQPSITYPVLSFTQATGGSYEVGTKLDLSCTISGSAGSYTYGPNTGVEWDTYSVTVNGTPGKIADDNVQTIAGLFQNANGDKTLPATGDFTNNAATINLVTKQQLVVCDDTSLTFTATGTHGAATANAKTNTGTVTDKTISADDAKSIRTQTTKTPISGVRKWFYGYKNSTNKIDISNLTSAQVRALTSAGSIPTSLTTTDMQQIIIAIPRGSSNSPKKTVTIKNSKNDAPQTVQDKTVHVEGANGFAAVEYYIYYVDNENSDGEGTTITYSISVK